MESAHVIDSQTQTLFVIPALNEQLSIGRAIESLRSQESKNWVAFIGDNNSTDLTTEVLNAFGDPRVYVKTWKSRTGSQANFLRTAEYALRKFPSATNVRFLAADDWLTDSTYISQVLSAMRDSDAVMPIILSDRGNLDLSGELRMRWSTSSSRLRRSIILSDWVFVNIIYAHFSRAAFEDLVSSLRDTESLGASADWATVLKWLLQKPRRIEFTSASLSRNTISRTGYSELHNSGNDSKKDDEGATLRALRDLVWPIIQFARIAMKRSPLPCWSLLPLVGVSRRRFIGLVSSCSNFFIGGRSRSLDT